MFYDNKRDSEWTQRVKNGLFLKWWVRNDTRDAALPKVLLAALIVLILVVMARLSGTLLGK